MLSWQQLLCWLGFHASDFATFYSQLHQQRMKEQAKLYSEDIKFIKMDVSQNFQNNIMFRENYSIK